MIEFRAEKKLARLHDPRQGFSLAAVEAEVRNHPLTGESACIKRFSMRHPEAVAADLRPFFVS